MIQVEYSFCRMRLPATGFTLPWQLVAAQEPGPTYLSFPMTFAVLSFCAKTASGNASATHEASNAASNAMRGLSAILIRGSFWLDSLYRLRAKEVKTGGKKFWWEGITAV